MNDIINSVPVLRQDYYYEMPQTPEACFYYPPLTDGKVILKGECPNADDINVVDDFDSELVCISFFDFFFSRIISTFDVLRIHIEITSIISRRTGISYMESFTRNIPIQSLKFTHNISLRLT